MSSRIETIPYDHTLALKTAQAFLEVFTTPPWHEAVSLNEAMSQVESDSQRQGFGGILLREKQLDNIIGFSWWFDISGFELHDWWRPRYSPKENVPQPEGRGVYLNEFGVIPAYQHKGLGLRMFQATLKQIEPDHDWIALSTQKYAHAGLALLKSQAFEDLGLVGVQVPTRICLMKYIRR
jgi:GNAT superfamily N-acetyltransferase